MPFFEYPASSSSSPFPTSISTKPQFWIYWAVTIPLTLLVIGIWAVWISVVSQRHKREYVEARRQLDAEMDKND
jgi:hypothetical protein